ncbi:MAG: bifunctional 4-hydroxy-3-methylbut-2-enyl diphosphate reductase/30S ribosomal protein S1 [Oscillospiraceae bacterium]
MSIEVAETAGFCFGVDKAVETVSRLLEEGYKVATLGPIIHNKWVVEEFKKKGVVVIDDIKDCPDGYTIIIRSHGVSKEIYEDIENNNLNYNDGTCPYVKKIHKIVEEESKTKTIFIAGDKSHPEIIGINGYCNNKAFIFEDIEDLEAEINSLEDKNIPIVLVAQTTFNINKWQIFLEFIKKHCTNVKIFDTICSATTERQIEAMEMARNNDVMIVVGGLHSSNSRKLKDVCSKYTTTYLIEDVTDLKTLDFGNAQKIGITAGASTPDAIIKEVLSNMSDKLDVMESEDFCFEKALEDSLTPVHRNQYIKGVVTAVSANEVQLDIGRKHTGIIHVSELTNDSSLSTKDVVKKGDEIEVMVLKVNDLEGTVMLSKKRVDAVNNFSQLVDAYDQEEVLDGKVTDVVKGGVLVLTKGMKVFVPASQLSLKRIENIDTFKNAEVKMQLIDIDKSKKRAIGSIKVLLEVEKREKQDSFWAVVKEGQVFKGEVKSLKNYGAFIDLGGIDGMVHISELSWSKIKHPKDILNVGQIVQVYIKDLDREQRKISLGYKKVTDNPWVIAETKFSVGDIVPAKVVSLTTFGAFAEIVGGVEGLIHISQIDNKKINKVSDALTIDQEVTVKIIELDFANKRVSLSIRALLEETEKEEERQIVDNYNKSVEEN